MRALPAPDAPRAERPPEAARGPDAAEPEPEPARRSAAERLAADRAKYVQGRPGGGRGPASEGSSPGAGAGVGAASGPQPPARGPGAVARRAIARRPLRPDSLVIYRQKCEFVRGPGPGAEQCRGGLVKRLLQGPGRDRTPAPQQPPASAGGEGRARGEQAALPGPGAAPAGPAAAPAAAPAAPAGPAGPAAHAGPAPAGPAAPAAPAAAPAAPLGPEPLGPRRRGLHRSQSDLSSRVSVPLAETDTFFQFCGLEPEVVEALGRENFSAGADRLAPRVRSVSVATSDSGFSRRSGGDQGLQEDELAGQVPSAPSVVERNARIIRWLYTCKKAKDTPGQGLQAPG